MQTSLVVEKPTKILVVLTNTNSLQGTSGTEQPSLTSVEPSARRTGFDVKELATFYMTLKKKGLRHNIIFATPDGGEAPIDPISYKQGENDQMVREFLECKEAMRMIKNSQRLEEVRSESVCAIIFPGGPGAVFDLPHALAHRQLVAKVYENHGVIAAIGHGVASLINIKAMRREWSSEFWIKDFKLTCISKEEQHEMKLDKELPFILEDMVRSRGANYEKREKFQSHVVVDERLVTGQNPQSAKDWATKTIELLQHHHPIFVPHN